LLSKLLEQIKIVLVEPSHPGNIGGAARAMKTMGLSQLVVINPKRFPDPQADWRAAGALDVLDNALVMPDVDSAIADCHWVVGTSTRMRKIPWPVADAKETATQVLELLGKQGERGRVAVLFGREDNGLSNDELRRCNAHLQIPAAVEYSSLNLAMAVQVVCYELFQASLTTPPVAKWDRTLASSSQVDDLVRALEQNLLETSFLDVKNPGQTITRLRRLFARAQMDETEVQILRGVIKHLTHTAPPES
jgi:tRNA (cytidine32/uridine32-2'-O)-methyltransferase